MTTNWVIVSNELCHHGIKGQRWGVRRFQNLDGTLTAAGKHRYETDVEGARKRLQNASQKAQNASQEYMSNPNQKNYANLENAGKQQKWAKEDLSSELIKEKLNSENKKSKHREKLEAAYRDKGMTEEEAAVAAYKRVRTEKILAGVAGVTVAAAAAYVTYRHYDRYVDKIIPKDTVLSRIASNSDKGVHDAFYASFKRSDNKKYLGLYGTQLMNSGKRVFQKTINLTDGLKVASEKTARSTMADLFKKDPNAVSDFKTMVEKAIQTGNLTNRSPKQMIALQRARSALNRGKIDSKAVYDVFNWDLVSRTPITDKFYNALRSKGYDAIMDVNDKRLSGFNSKSPVIVINAAKSVVDKVRPVSVSEISGRFEIESLKMQVKNMLKISGITVAGMGASSILQKVSESRKDSKYVEEYRKEHPNTKLSYTEIIRNRG